MNSDMDCMVSLSAIEILCFFHAGAICGKEENWLLVLGAGQSDYNTENGVWAHCPTAKQEYPCHF